MKKLLLTAVIIGVCTIIRAQQIKDSEVPANVRSLAALKLPTAANPLWALDKNRKWYTASVMNTTIMRVVEVSVDGKWLGTTDGVPPHKMPAAVMTTLKSEYLENGYEAFRYFFVDKPGFDPCYLVDISFEDEDLRLTFSPAGEVLKQEPL